MKTQFDLTIEDEIAYREAVFWHTSNGTWTIVVAILCPIIAFNAICLWLLQGNPAITMLAVVGVTAMLIGWFFAFQKLRPWLIDWHTRREMAGLKGRMALGPHEMELCDNLIIITTELATYHFDLRTIKKIDFHELRSTVTLGSGASFVIPRFPIRNAQFIAALRFAWNNLSANPALDEQVPIDTHFEARRPPCSEVFEQPSTNLAANSPHPPAAPPAN